VSVSTATGDSVEEWTVHDGVDDVIAATPERLLPSCLPDLVVFGVVMCIRRVRREEGTKSLTLLLDVYK
jgi:hypothetical protein